MGGSSLFGVSRIFLKKPSVLRNRRGTCAVVASLRYANPLSCPGRFSTSGRCGPAIGELPHFPNAVFYGHEQKHENKLSAHRFIFAKEEEKPSIRSLHIFVASDSALDLLVLRLLCQNLKSHLIDIIFLLLRLRCCFCKREMLRKYAVRLKNRAEVT